TVTRIWGIPIRINVSLFVFLPILAWLIGSGQQVDVYAGLIGQLTGVDLALTQLRAGSTPWVIGITAAIGLFLSVTLHELGHSWVALRYGIGIDSITLWILGGIASLQSLPREWNREFWIAIAGPITSLLVAGGCWIGLQLVPPSLPVPRFVVGWLAITNVILAGFNLLPAFPMDGGRVLRALLARSRSYARATQIAGRIGVIFAMLFAVVGVLSFSVLLILLALFIYGAATTESRTVLVDELLDGLTVGDIMLRDPPDVTTGTTITELLNRMIRDRQQAYLVTDDGTAVGVVTLADLRRVDAGDRNATTVEAVMQDVPRINVAADAFDSFVRIANGSTPYAIVEDDTGVAGLLSQTDYAHALTIQRGFSAGIAG
ncbi:MAG: site-2 protease family protein, partial [Halobacteriales archaeon]